MTGGVLSIANVTMQRRLFSKQPVQCSLRCTCLFHPL